MFTGIVVGLGTVKAIKPQRTGVRLVIARRPCRLPGVRVQKGHSICISGVCLTVVQASPAAMAFDVIPETLRKTILGDLHPGSAVNMEASLTPQTVMGGHFLQGHVDGVGVVTGVMKAKGEWRVAVRPPAGLMDYIVPKGSVAIDGVSLTIASVGRREFDVALIPTTLDLTTLGLVKEETRVNLETDIISKTIVHYLQQHRK